MPANAISLLPLARRIRPLLLIAVLAACIALPGAGAVTAEADAALHEREARPSPEWLTRGVMYQVWLRSFTPEGTLAAATKRLEGVAGLGATIVYLGPMCLQDADMRPEFWSKRQKASGTNNPRNPYRIADYYRIDPEYGTEDDLRAFVAEAHRLDLRVLLDLVYFHCGPTSVLIDRPGFIKRDASNNISTGNWNFPVLNFESPEVREYFWDNMEFWVREFDVDGYRCDVADMIPLPFWEEARTRLDALRPGLVLLAEGQRREDQVRAFDVDYGFTWYNALAAVGKKGSPAVSLRTTWEEMSQSRPKGNRFIRYTENHDIVNDLQRADVVFSRNGANAASVLNFTMDGVPFLYNGQEVGDTTVQSIFARYPIRWEAACLPESQARLAFYKELCRLRRNEPVLANGEMVWLDNDNPDAVVSFLRRSSEGQIISVINFSNRHAAVSVALDEGASEAYTPMLEYGAKVSVEDGDLTFESENFGYFVGKAP